MREIIYETIKDADGVDCYIKRGEVVRCKDCKHRHGDECPMRHVEWVECEEDGFVEMDDIVYDNTDDDGYCSYGEREGGEA